jgi:hypothetical protein
MSSNDLDLNRIQFQNTLRSKQVDDNFQNIQTEFNALRSQYLGTASSTASEIVDARDGMTALEDNIHLRNIYPGFHNTGGVVTASGNNIVSISAGSAIVNGVGTEWTAASSATIGAATTGRKDIVQINSAGTLSIAQGTDGATAPLPTLDNTKRPLYMITVDTASPQVITAGRITDVRRQGCYANGKYFFAIQDAVDFVSRGEIRVMPGEYYEEVDLSGKSNIKLLGDPGVNLYRPGGSNYGMKCVNSGGNESENLLIEGFNFKGNSKGGDFQNLRMTYTDKFTLRNCSFDGNSSSSSTMKDFLFSNCDEFHLYENNYVNWYASTSQFNTCTKYFEDGFLKAQFVFCASTSEFNNMKARGFTLLTAMGTRFPKANQTTAEGTGGSTSHSHTVYQSNGDSVDDQDGAGTNITALIKQLGGIGIVAQTKNGSDFLNSDLVSDAVNTEPAYYDMIPLIHR